MQDHVCQGKNTTTPETVRKPFKKGGSVWAASCTPELQKNGTIILLIVYFLKSRYWSSDNGKNEVQGVVLNRAGEVVHRFGGLWHEGIFCDTLPTPKCIWKPSEYHQFCFHSHGLVTVNINCLGFTAVGWCNFSRIAEQPNDFFDYYGFSRYARELNELTPELELVLPPTDTRFRPDQRFRAFHLFFSDTQKNSVWL